MASWGSFIERKDNPFAGTLLELYPPVWNPIYDPKFCLGPATSTTNKNCLIAFSTSGTENAIMRVRGSGLTYDTEGNITGGTVTGWSIEDEEGTAYARFSFEAVDAVTFYTAVQNDNTFDADGRYRYLVSLLDDDTQSTGTKGSEGFELGAGDDTVVAGGGHDMVFKWSAGDLDADGGSGSDSVVFMAATGLAFPTSKTQQLIVDLSDTKGSNGQNPYGGLLFLRDVENIVGTNEGDRITGNNKANLIGDGISDAGADRIRCLGGDDTVQLAEGGFGNTGGVDADGGKGHDTLTINVGLWDYVGEHRLDLTDQSSNNGVFANDILTGFESFLHGEAFFAPDAVNTFVFVDTDDGHTVETLAPVSKLAMNGGNDTVVILTNIVTTMDASGGAGKDTLSFTSFGFGDLKNRIDLKSPEKNLGLFENCTLSGFEIFDGNDTAFAASGSTFEFIGDSKAQMVMGTGLADKLVMSGGDDAAHGGAGNDVVSGGDGNDRLGGGAGSNKLAGGDGEDAFLFDAAINTVNVSVILDYDRADDVIELDNAAFVGLGTGKLSTGQFVIGKQAVDASDRIIYDEDKGRLYFDIDGSGVQTAVLFARVDAGTSLTASEFMVV